MHANVREPNAEKQSRAKKQKEKKGRKKTKKKKKGGEVDAAAGL